MSGHGRSFALRLLDRCAVCDVPRFAHGWPAYRRRTNRMPFREPIDFDAPARPAPPAVTHTGPR